MAFCGPLRVVPAICLNLRPKFCRPTIFGDASQRINHFYPRGLHSICGKRVIIVKQISGVSFRLSERIINELPLLKQFSTARTLLKVETGGQGKPTVFSPEKKQGTRSTLYYIAALGVVALGLSYAAVPLYRIFCQAYSYGGTTQKGHDAEKVETMKKVEDRVITVRFNADTAASMTWNFRPQQHEIKVMPGETALAFYTARNPTDRPVIGVSTYNVVPFDAGQYFNKIQCFCFEEQLLNPHEEVHMPVFFYIDPEFVDDPKMESTDMLTLSYTFFEAREGVQIPIPNFART